MANATQSTFFLTTVPNVLLRSTTSTPNQDEEEKVRNVELFLCVILFPCNITLKEKIVNFQIIVSKLPFSFIFFLGAKIFSLKHTCFAALVLLLRWS